MEPIQLMSGIFTGIVAGVGWGLTGYIVEKSKSDSKEKFDGIKFLRSVFSGAFIGGVAGAMGMELEVTNFESLALMYPLTSVVDMFVKFLQRLVKKVTK